MNRFSVLVIAAVLGLTGCGGGSDSAPKQDICDQCSSNSDCYSGLTCEELYQGGTGISWGGYCIDEPSRRCAI